MTDATRRNADLRQMLSDRRRHDDQENQRNVTLVRQGLS